MSKLTLKQKIIGIIAALGIALILIFQRGLYNKPATNNNPVSSPEKTEEVNNKEAKILSTKPSPLDGAIVLPNQIIEITYNLPLENTGEFKHKFDPEVKKDDYKLELSNDKKTIKIIPIKPFKLGTEFTLFILPDTKFEGGVRTTSDTTFHFQTISYQGV